MPGLIIYRGPDWFGFAVVWGPRIGWPGRESRGPVSRRGFGVVRIRPDRSWVFGLYSWVTADYTS